jgi:hypothetical protein
MMVLISVVAVGTILGLSIYNSIIGHISGIADMIFGAGLMSTVILSKEPSGPGSLVIAVPKGSDLTKLNEAKAAAPAFGGASVIELPGGIEEFGNITRQGVRGVFIDSGLIEDNTVGGLAVLLNGIEPSRIALSSKTREELERIMDRIREMLPDIDKVDLDRDLAQIRASIAANPALAEQLAALKTALDARKREIAGAYNGSSVSIAIAEATKDNRARAIALTETIVGNDIFSADNMAEVVKNARIKPVFVYGTQAGGKASAITDDAKAREFLRSCGYDEQTISKITLIKGTGLSHEQLVGLVHAQPGIGASAMVGIAAAEGEFARTSDDPSVLLEVAPAEIQGQKIYATMNTIQTLLNVLAQAGTDTINVPDVTFDAVRKIFRYIPRAIPIDYTKEVQTFRNAVKFIRTAA